MVNSKMRQHSEQAISDRLKAYYKSVEEEPIPDKFLDLLEKLDRAEQENSKSSNEDSSK